ncbi:MAG: LysR family transcriptional regulator [Acetobacter sp.]|nr:LysR family transcriptional regulator [Acetobacter sp.]MCH4062644.1 LysR family transcriptional regulator [Acetobacter sp.]MCH4088510.1 LysR family transcriptional regulator [Acetobacter sp.]MCI1293977.1 LysR family transcriptional regulator [Acetobacter sp.]MCI1320632.1 LysR family transcriptional regulator [Acetobacter sp.]
MSDIRSLDLNLLRALDILLEEGSVTRTAERLGVTQPAVSNMLTRLRENFDDPLLVRTQRGMTPTTRALDLVTPLKRILCEIGTLCQPDAFDPASASFTASIAATDYALQVVLLPFIAQLRQEAPGITLAVHPLDDGRLQEQLEKGQIDMAVTTPETCPPDMLSSPLFHEEYICAARKNHPTANRKMTLDQYCEAGHIIVSYEGGRFCGATDRQLETLGRTRHVALSVPNFLALPDLLLKTDLITMAPRKLLHGRKDLALFSPPSPLTVPGFDNILVWHCRTGSDPRYQWLRGKVTDIIKCVLERT